MQTSPLEIIAQVSIMLAILVLTRLSFRLGGATKGKQRHVGFYIAAAIMFISIVARVLNWLFEITEINEIQDSLLWVLLYNGLPALSITLALVFAWHYWSWLLAERD